MERMRTMERETPCKIGAITIGQSPRVDMTGDMLTRLPGDLQLMEYGVLDDYTMEQVEEQFTPHPGDEVLVSRMRDGSQARLAGHHVDRLLQRCILKAEADGVSAIILLCTGGFPEFRHSVPLIRPQPLFYAVAQKLADGAKIAVMVPDPAQEQQARDWWGKSGIDIQVVSASPYGEMNRIAAAARTLKGCGAPFLCLDCMGFTQEMKKVAGRESGLPVLLPRTLIASIAAEFLSFQNPGDSRAALAAADELERKEPECRN